MDPTATVEDTFAVAKWLLPCTWFSASSHFKSAALEGGKSPGPLLELSKLTKASKAVAEIVMGKTGWDI